VNRTRLLLGWTLFTTACLGTWALFIYALAVTQ
jgi:hypothetical protein